MCDIIEIPLADIGAIQCGVQKSEKMPGNAFYSLQFSVRKESALSWLWNFEEQGSTDVTISFDLEGSALDVRRLLEPVAEQETAQNIQSDQHPLAGSGGPEPSSRKFTTLASRVLPLGKSSQDIVNPGPYRPLGSRPDYTRPLIEKTEATTKHNEDATNGNLPSVASRAPKIVKRARMENGVVS